MSVQNGAAAADPERDGVLAVLQDEAMLDRLNGVIREQRLRDEVVVEATLDAALRRLREGLTPRLLFLDLSSAAAPIAEVSAARAVSGREVKLVALGNVNDVAHFRDLISAGANDYLVKPPSREALSAVLEKPAHAENGDAGLGHVVVFLGSRGGVGTTTAAVSSAWLLAEEQHLPTALIDLDLHFGTVALKLDTDPGNGLCEALEQPSRIDSIFIDAAMVKMTEHLRVLAAEASPSEPITVDAGAIDMLLYELRRKFRWIVIDLPREAIPLQHAVLAAASHVVLVCERSLAGLRDTIRLQTLLRDQASQIRLVLVEAGTAPERALVSRSEFEKGTGKGFEASLSYDPKSAEAAANTGQPLPLAAPRSPVLRELRQLVSALAGAPEKTQKRRLSILRSIW